MGHGSWWILHSEPTQLVASGYSRTSTNQMAHLTRTKQGSWKKDLHRKKALIRLSFVVGDYSLEDLVCLV
jgi:hypothetical protein